MAKQLGDPLGVGDIRFSPRDIFDPLRIGKSQVEIAFEEGKNRFPIHTGRLYGDMGDTMLFEPLEQVTEPLRERRKCLDLFLNLPFF